MKKFVKITLSGILCFYSLYALAYEESALDNFYFNETHNENNYGFFPSDDDFYSNESKKAILLGYFRKKQSDDFDAPMIFNDKLAKENALIQAVIKGNISLAKSILNNGMDPNVKNKDGATALHFAAAANDAIMTKLLLDFGADPNYINNDGDTPLHIAAKESAFSVARTLMQYNADTSIEDNENKKPIDYATNNRMRSIILKDKSYYF